MKHVPCRQKCLGRVQWVNGCVVVQWERNLWNTVKTLCYNTTTPGHVYLIALTLVLKITTAETDASYYFHWSWCVSIFHIWYEAVRFSSSHTIRHYLSWHKLLSGRSWVLGDHIACQVLQCCHLLIQLHPCSWHNYIRYAHHCLHMNEC